MAAKAVTKPLRLLLLPISTRRSLIYCEPASAHLPAAQQTYVDKAVNKAAKTWSEWEKAKSTFEWKHKVTSNGNKLLKRIPFEEWGLKSIPSMRKAREQLYETEPDNMRVEVQFPGLYQGLLKENVLDTCKRLSTERQSFHRNKLWQSTVIMPFTAPVALIPVIPNLPFLYLVFRAYSHARAFYGSKHLEYLANNNLLSAKPSSMLDSLYTAGLWHPTREETRKGSMPSEQQTQQVVDIVRRQMDKEKKTTTAAESGAAATEEQPELMLLKGWNGKLLAEKLGLPELEVEIERAVEQVERDLEKAKKLREENVVTQKVQ